MTDISPEDKDLFRQHMHDVTPLVEKKAKIKQEKPAIKPATKQHLPTPTTTKPLIKYRKPPKTPIQHVQNDLSDFIVQPVAPEAVLSYQKSALPQKQWKQLIKGAIPWSARLDLHGLNTNQAREALCQFIAQKHSNRCVLIIHGKGGQAGEAPVIKNLLNRWLPQFEQVLAFHSAQPQHGGTGAVYVLFKNSATVLYSLPSRGES